MTSYNLGNNSDMKKFKKNLEKKIITQATQSLKSKKYSVTCEECKQNVNVPVGKSLCPKCGKEINLELNIDF